MSSKPLVEFRDVNKVYRRGAERMNLRALLPGRAGRRANAGDIRALHAVTFAVNAGRVLGIIGANGAGKSTILKLAARVAAPSSGMVCTRGRICSLIELGVGFHPDLSGRDNVRFAG